MDCKEAQILFAPRIMGDLEPVSVQYLQLEAHLLSCQACRERYEIRDQTIAFIEQHKAIFAEALRTTEEKKATEKEEIELSWKRIEARLDELEVQERKEKRAKFHRLIVRVSAIAACLVVGISTFLTYSIYSKPKIDLKATVRIELVSDNGNILIPADRQIFSSDELKTLIIDGKHRIVMNTNTILAVGSLGEKSNIGCLVKLDTGRIYAHVEHEDDPFIVDTVHGKAVITGTTFDVKVTGNSTTLVVSEGTVQFESEKGFVKVAAGQTSEIVGQSAPSIPLSCNTAELTAWATSDKAKPALAQVESNAYPEELSLSLRKAPIVLGETDYESWVEQQRNWFKQEFTWIFQLKEALAKEDIEADYPELLTISGDVWQFVCLDVVPPRFSVVDFDSVLKTASNYGFDKQWLLANVPIAKSALEKPALSENCFTGLKAFERWLDYLDETTESKPPTSIYSYHASKYLAETRSLIWFAVRDGQYDLKDQERIKILELLQEEVTAACKCQNEVLYPKEEPKSSCDDICLELVDSVVAYIETMKNVEEKNMNIKSMDR